MTTTPGPDEPDLAFAAPGAGSDPRHDDAPPTSAGPDVALPYGRPADAPPTSAGPDVALRLRGLTKRFGETLAVDRLDLDIPTGTMFGVVGPNGAGKTTTLSMATGLLAPDAGEVHVYGVDLWREPARAKPLLGVLPDGLRVFDRLTGAELISYAGLLRGLPADVVEQRRDDLLTALDLAGAARTLVADFSAGMAKKITLACALVHAPRLLVLDEPFEAVDPVSAGVIRRILAQFVAEGGTVVLSSHVMALVERMCDHVAVIGAGRVLATGPLDDVRAGADLEERFFDLLGARGPEAGLAWLRPS